MRWSHIRDGLLFLGGLAGAAHETLASKADRPTLLLLFAAMMGLPAFLKADDSRSEPPASPPGTPSNGNGPTP